MPNTNNGNGNEGFNPVSLGSIDQGNVNNIPPVPPVESLNTQPVDSLNNGVIQDNVNSTPAVNPVPPVEPVSNPSSVPPVTPNVDPMNPIPPVAPIDPVAPVSYDVPETINNFNTTPVFNEIGTVPPIPDGPVQAPTLPPEEGKPKKKMNKTVFFLIIVLLIAAVGVGVYIFLNMSNGPAVRVTPKAVEIEVGSEVSTNIEDYATFSGINSSECSLDTSNITDTNTVGAEYPFTITCNSVTYNGTATIVNNNGDVTPPEVELKQVTVEVNGEVSPEDFIVSCSEEDCTYEFSNPDMVAGYLATAANYHVDIIVRDAAGNSVTVTGTLIVSAEEVPDIYLSCTAGNETLKLGITENNFTGNAIRTYTFTFDREEEYNTFKSANKNNSSVSYQNVTGTPSFDDSTLTLTLTQTLTKAQLDQEAGSTLPTAYGDIRSYYVGEGYTCSLEQP